MTADTAKTIAETIESVLKSFGIIIGAAWVYWKFVHKRLHEATMDVDLEVVFVGKQNEKWIVEITAVLRNKSSGRLRYEDFQVVARYVLPDDPIQDGSDRINYQLRFPRTIDERIGGGKRFFANAEWINPGQEFRHRYITYIPIEATFVWVQTRHFFNLRGRQKSNAQKILRVPRNEEELLV
jgi:hypothetical protein